MPVPTETPPAAKNSGAGRDHALGRSTEKGLTDFKTTLEGIDAHGRADQSGNASSAPKKTLSEGGDRPEINTGDEPSAESVMPVAETVDAEINPSSPPPAMGLAGWVALPTDDSTAIPPTQKGLTAAPPNLKELQGGNHSSSVSEANPSPLLAEKATVAPAADGEIVEPQKAQTQGPSTEKPVILRPSIMESKAETVQGGMRSTEIPKPMADLPAPQPKAGDDPQTVKTGNPINTVSDNVREATRPPSAAMTQAASDDAQTVKTGNPINAVSDSVREATRPLSAATTRAAGSDRQLTDETEGRVRTDGLSKGEEGIETGAARSFSKDTPTASHRLVQAARPDIEQRPEGIVGFERGAGAPLEKAAPPPPAEKPLPPSPDGFRDSNLSSLVERIAVTVRGSQSEARMVLKPEHLGSLRVQISTDNNVVSIKIMTEFSMARDLLESSLPQLKAELQQQGLEVEEFNVSVDDEKQPFGREERRARGSRPDRQNSGDTVEEEPHAPEEETPGIRRRPVARSSGIDHFV
jgi:flagellar hook-length control protein FliK